MGSRWKFTYVNYNFLTYFYFLKICLNSKFNKDLYMKDRSLVIQYCYLFKFLDVKFNLNLIKNLIVVDDNSYLNIDWDLLSSFKNSKSNVDSLLSMRSFEFFEKRYRREFDKNFIKFLFFRISGLLESAEFDDDSVGFLETDESGEIARKRLLGNLFVYSGKRFRKIPLSVYSVGYKLGDFVLTKKPSFFRTKKKKGARYLKR